MENLKKRLEDLQSRWRRLQDKLDPQVRAAQMHKLEAQSRQPDFWADPTAAQAAMKRLATLKEEEQQIGQLGRQIAAVAPGEDINNLEKQLAQLETGTFLDGPYDPNNAIVGLHAGQGGTEAMDWVAMLLRMYWRFCSNRGWTTEIVDQTAGEEAGFKSVVFTVGGPYAYGYLKGEAGTHRLVRQSPFNADNLRQTSFALVEVLPQLPAEKEIEIKPDQVEFAAFRASSHGGQNVNKVSTAVRLIHKATGITVTCQSQRSQEQNRKLALGLLAAKLWQRQQEQRLTQEKRLKGAYRPASWGHQIRSYVLHPYRLVKDLRTGVETGQAEAVLDGDLQLFIDAQVRLAK